MIRFAGALLACLILAVSAGVGALGDTALPASNATAVPAVAPSGPRKPGDSFAYTIHGSMTQAIKARDTLGRKVNQPGVPTTLDGRELVAVQDVNVEGMTLRRSGEITAVVADKSVGKKGSGWTLVREDGTIARDQGNLGGIFLMPVPYLASKSVNAGADLQVGTQWTEKLGTRLYGMTAQPTMSFAVIGQHLALGVQVFEIDATGTAPMKEPVIADNGEPLGYATGAAQISIHAEYDPADHRMISMDIELSDDLHIAGANKKAGGTVGDHQHYVVALDASTLTAGVSLPMNQPAVIAPVRR